MRNRALWIGIGLLALAPAVHAGEPKEPDFIIPVGTPATLHGALQLSLADAIAMGLENNLGVEIQRHEPLIAHEDYRAAWGSYDPLWSGEVNYSDVQNPNANAIVGVPQQQQTLLEGNTGFSGLIPWLGTSYDMRLISDKIESNSGIASLSPQYDTDVNFSVSQPLMRGLIWSQPWTLVKTSRVFEMASLEQFRADVMNTVRFIEDAYWNLIADEERVRVAEKSLETATALLERVKTQYEVGVVSKVEIAEADAGVAGRDFDLIEAQNRYRNSMDVLIDLVLGQNLTADSRITIDPTDRADTYFEYDVDVEQATEIAFANRPEVAIAQLSIDQQELGLKFAKNDRLPQLDAVAGYGNRGLAGASNPACATSPFCVFNPALDIPYGNAYNGFLGQGAAEQWTVGAVVSIPIPNTTARAGVSRAELELRRAQVSKRRVEQDIILEIRRSARTLKAAQEGIAAAERRQVAAQEQLRAEEIRLEYGESTPFDVLLREEDLVSAEQGYIGAFQVYRTSLTELDRAQGTILRNRNVEIDQVAPLR